MKILTSPLAPLFLAFGLLILASCASAPSGGMAWPQTAEMAKPDSGAGATNAEARRSPAMIDSSPGLASPSPSQAPATPAPAPAPAPARDRPGLGTGWGGWRSSRIEQKSFRRQSADPIAAVSAFYNDEVGLKAMGQRLGGGHRVLRPQPAGPGVTWAVRSSNGRMLPTYRYGERLLVRGKPGDTYKLSARNSSERAVEVVFSVDGLDVIDGKAASFGKRGYLIPAGGEVEVAGWRRDTNSVASFQFSSVADSYTEQRHGEARNVGVIGLAVFPEHYQSWYERTYRVKDSSQRTQALAFPEN